MDILSILFLIFGWIFDIKGLVITSLILASVLIVFNIAKGTGADNKDEEKQKKVLREIKISMFIDFILLAMSIVKLCIQGVINEIYLYKS